MRNARRAQSICKKETNNAHSWWKRRGRLRWEGNRYKYVNRPFRYSSVLVGPVCIQSVATNNLNAIVFSCVCLLWRSYGSMVWCGCELLPFSPYHIGTNLTGEKWVQQSTYVSVSTVTLRNCSQTTVAELTKSLEKFDPNATRNARTYASVAVNTDEGKYIPT